MHISGIPGNKLIGRDQREAFDLGLGYQHARWRLIHRAVERTDGALTGNAAHGRRWSVEIQKSD